MLASAGCSRDVRAQQRHADVVCGAGLPAAGLDAGGQIVVAPGLTQLLTFAQPLAGIAKWRQQRILQTGKGPRFREVKLGQAPLLVEFGADAGH